MGAKETGSKNGILGVVARLHAAESRDNPQITSRLARDLGQPRLVLAFLVRARGNEG